MSSSSHRLDKKAFTLIELLVVIAIIAIIAGTKTPRVRSYSISTGMAWVNIPDPSYCSYPDSYDPTPGAGNPPSARKFNQIVNPAPAKASVFLDEREDSIDNGAIGIYP